MNYTLIFAGGVGRRMNSQAKPKQFLEIHGKPILIHTIELFETHPEIDGIAVVCVADWMAYTKELVDKFRLKRVRWIIEGGSTALESQYKGLCAIKADIDDAGAEDIVLIHDGVRPLINGGLISDCIASVKNYGSAVTVSPAIETIAKADDAGMITSTVKRDECLLARAPQAFYLSDIIAVHDKSVASGCRDYIDSASMMLAHGYRVHTVLGPAENIKVTNPADFYICRALMDAKENSQFGI